MPITAYSKKFERELDVEQLLKLHFGLNDGPVDQAVNALTVADRNFIRSDLECPSCFQGGAEVVTAGRSRRTGQLVRQAYFRFKDSEGGEGHHPSCDFYQEAEKAGSPENFVAFSSPKSNLTRAVRELVCRGVELGLFSQRTMRDLRQWFFKEKLALQFEVTIDPRLIEQLQDLRGWARPRPFPFDPLFAELPGFDWRAAACDHIARRYSHVLDGLREGRLLLHGDECKRAIGLARRYHGQSVFDPSCLETQHSRTVDLCRFLTANYQPLIHCQIKDVEHPALLAFSALLLFVSGWDGREAIQKFVAIAKQQEFDPTAGNFMGLNPFHYYDAWRLLKGLHDLGPVDLGSNDVRELIADTERELREQHGRWKEE